MDRDSGVITRLKFRMWLRPDGIVQIVWVPRTTVVLEDVVATREAKAQLTGGRRRPLLVDMRLAGPQDRATRAEWSTGSDLTSAVALIVGTPVSGMMGTYSTGSANRGSPYGSSTPRRPQSPGSRGSSADNDEDLPGSRSTRACWPLVDTLGKVHDHCGLVVRPYCGSERSGN
jgi:hypothetical protein